jgi:hypothetical protein
VEEAEKRRGIKRVTGAREPSKAAVDRLHVSDTAAYALDLLLPSVFFLPNSAGGSVLRGSGTALTWWNEGSPFLLACWWDGGVALT